MCKSESRRLCDLDINLLWLLFSMQLPNSPHYGMEYRIEVIDATTDNPTGTTLLTTQGLLQDQRDSIIAEHGLSLLQFLKGPIRFDRMRTLLLELRAGVKSGFSPDFFVSRSEQASGAVNADMGQSGMLAVAGTMRSLKSV